MNNQSNFQIATYFYISTQIFIHFEQLI
uniref:Uncharacterized protein n=1 Tax=Anguilla anguilla TaxID=7936 RepID=A0A0E9U253_ANGAN